MENAAIGKKSQFLARAAVMSAAAYIQEKPRSNNLFSCFYLIASMKRLNTKLVVLLGLGFCFAVVGTHLLHGYQVNRNADSLKERAAEANKAGEIVEEVRLLSRFLQYRPEDIDARISLLKSAQKAAMETGDMAYWRMTFTGFERAIQNNPENTELLREWLNFVIQPFVGRTADAVDCLKKLDAQNELLAEDKVSWARCDLQLGQTDQAVDRLSELIGFDKTTEEFLDTPGTDPKELSAYRLLAAIYNGRIKASDDLEVPGLILDKMVAENQENYKAYIIRADFLSQLVKEGGYDQGYPDVKKALQLGPDEIDTLITAARFQRVRKEVTTAEATLYKATKLFPNDRRAYLQLAELAVADKRPERAIKYLNDGLNQEGLKFDNELMVRRTEIEIDSGQIEEAKKAFQRISRRLPPVYRNYISAKILLSENKVVEAEQLLESMRPQLKSAPRLEPKTLRLLTQCYRRLGKRDMLNTVTDRDPDSMDARFERAQSLTGVGRYDEALAILKGLFEDKNLPVEARELILGQTLSTRIAQQKSLPEEKRNWTVVDQLANRRKSVLRGAELERFEISMLMQKGQIDKARQRVSNAVLLYSKISSFWLQLVQLTNDPQEKQAVIARMEKQVGDGIGLRLAKAESIAQLNPPDATAQLQALLQNLDGIEEKFHPQIMQSIAAQLRTIGAYDEAISIWRQLLSGNETNVMIHSMIFDLAIQAENEQAMDDSIASFQEITGNESSEVFVARARKLFWQIRTEKVGKDKLADVRSLLEKAAVSRPDWSIIFEIRSDAFRLEGNSEEAVTNLELAFEKNPAELRYAQKLADLLFSLGRNNEAQKYLSLLPDTQKSNENAKAEILLLASQDPNGAVKRARELVSKDSEEPFDWIFLANVFMRVQQSDNALKSFQKAISCDPNLHTAWLRYFECMSRYKKTQMADQALAQIERLVEKDKEMLLGQCNAHLGRVDKAESYYAKAYQLDPQNAVLIRNLIQLYLATQKNEQGMEMLDKLLAISNNDDNVKEHQKWGRRQKATLMSKTMLAKDFKEAIQLLDQNRDELGKLDAEDSFVWLQLHANRPEATSRQKALQELERLSRIRKLSIQERSVHAALLNKANRWNEAQEIMIEILAAQPNNGVLIAQFVNWLIDRDEIDNAAKWARKLPPGSGEALRLNSIILVRQKRPQEAVKMLSRLVPKDLPAERAGTLRDVAQMYTMLAEYDPRFYKLADGLWNRFLAFQPQQKSGYINFLFKIPSNKTMERAFQLCREGAEKAIQSKDWNSAFRYASVASNGIRENKEKLTPSSPIYAQVERWLMAAKNAGFNPTAVAWERAAVAELKGDQATVEKIYRDYLNFPEATQFHKSLVRNNLAHLMAVSGRGEEAIQMINDAIQSVGEQADLLDTRAMAFIAIGNYRDAIADLQSIINAGDDVGPTWFHLGYAQYKQGDQDAAKQSMQKAFDLEVKEIDLESAEQSMFQEVTSGLGMVPPQS